MNKETIHFLQKGYRRFENLIKYCLIGVSGASLDFILYSLLVQYTGIHYQYINIFSTTVGIINNFILNSCFNFKVKDHMFRRFLSFYAVGGIGILITAGLLHLLVEILKTHPVPAKILTVVIVTVVQFLLNKFITFRKEKR